MPRDKLLRGVIGNIVDHAMSGLSFLHPHLSEWARSNHLMQIKLNLLKEVPIDTKLKYPETVKLSTEALHRKFIEIIEKNGFVLSDVASAEMTFDFLPDFSDHTVGFSCTCELVSARGKKFKYSQE
jgi:hypothetical protein